MEFEVLVSVSIVIPVRNGERYIVEAIESVLLQGETIGEVLVVDDGSTDTTAQRWKVFPTLASNCLPGHREGRAFPPCAISACRRRAANGRCFSMPTIA